MNEQSIRRVQFLARALFVWAALIVGRLAWLQIIDHDHYKHQALKQQERIVEVQAERGKILDREGQVLAMSMPVDSVCINPLRVPDLTVAADILSTTLHLEARSLARKNAEGRRRPARFPVDQEAHPGGRIQKCPRVCSSNGSSSAASTSAFIPTNRWRRTF